MNFSLQQNLETIVRFMYQKDDIPNFSYFDSLISKITEDSISDFPELEKKREDLYKQYFKENNIPEIIINGALVTDFEKISKISHLFPTSVPSFDSPISDTKKNLFLLLKMKIQK